MGDSGYNNQRGHQQQQSDRLAIHSVFGNMDLPINTRMAEIKLLLTVVNFLGFGLFGYTLFINIDNIKGWILMILGSAFMTAKLYFYIKRSHQAVKKEEQEAEMRGLEIEEKKKHNNRIKK